MGVVEQLVPAIDESVEKERRTQKDRDRRETNRTTPDGQQHREGQRGGRREHTLICRWSRAGHAAHDQQCKVRQGGNRAITSKNTKNPPGRIANCNRSVGVEGEHKNENKADITTDHLSHCRVLLCHCSQGAWLAKIQNFRKQEKCAFQSNSQAF